MVLIFDLDDTLFDEMSYVKGGFHAVADFCQKSYGWSASSSYSLMLEHLLHHGRGHVFDELLKYNNSFTKSKVLTLLRVYRNHVPRIALDKNIIKLLEILSSIVPLYVVTDGNKTVQQKKITALGIQKYFKSCLITHRYGVKHSKPSLYCFEKIRRLENRSWHELIYIGDNPRKDFINLNSVGAHTIRVLTGCHASVVALPGFDAFYTIESLNELPNLLSTMNQFQIIKSVSDGNKLCWDMF